MDVNQKLKNRRVELGLTMLEVAKKVGVSEATISRWESGDIANMRRDKISLLANALEVSPAFIMGWDDDESLFPSEDITYMEVIGSVKAGYDGLAQEEHTGEIEAIPTVFFKGHSKNDFFLLRVSGNSMYPKMIDGDLVLVKRETSVDSGSVAVVLYGDGEATIKTVKYTPGEDWLDLIPANPEYVTKHIEGAELEKCRILGKVMKLIRNM